MGINDMVANFYLQNVETESEESENKNIKQTNNNKIKKQLKWIIPVSGVAALLLLFIVFEVTRGGHRNGNTKNNKKSKK